MTHESGDSVERLVRLAGERDLPSPEAMRRARAASEQAWRRMLAVRSPHGAWRRFVGLALAAGLAAAWWFIRPAEEPAVVLDVGRIVALQGGATAHAPDKVWRLTADEVISTGTTLETAQGRLALSLGSAASLRIDRGTRLRVDTPDHVTLLAGSLYVDSGGLNVSAPLRIATPAGEIGHIGTQFQVFVGQSLTRVRVREGRVQVTSPGGATQALATGDALEVRGAERVLSRGLPVFGAEWAWVGTIGTVLDIENRPLPEFLAWLSREQGWQLRYASDELQAEAAQIRLHGSLDGLDAVAMLDHVTLVTGVPLQARDGVLWVGMPR